ncbi:LysR family transcriptional regulator [Streptomyces sp. ODS28]|uniref:LysR family transcriptional regulator n=1 Tax=Streptomyces sp. ODS28 TaxID=3136688 RepID=UPI0031E6B090
MLDVRRLRLLRELALRGTIAAVADALAFSPSAVSQQLSALEREAGVPLLERTGRRVVLTPAGHQLVDHAAAVLERLEQAAADLAASREGPAGPVRIGVFPTAARALVPAALAELAREHPKLEPMVREVDPAAVGDALRASELDVALIHDYDFVPYLAEPGLTTEPLCVEALYLATAALALPAEEREGPTISGCEDASWITATPGTLCHTMTVRACHAAGFRPRIRHQVDDFATVLDLVASGQGVALVPQLGAADPPGAVRLTRVPIHRHTRIAVRSGAGTHPAVAAAAAALRATVPGTLCSADQRGADAPEPPDGTDGAGRPSA